MDLALLFCCLIPLILMIIGCYWGIMLAKVGVEYTIADEPPDIWNKKQEDDALFYGSLFMNQND